MDPPGHAGTASAASNAAKPTVAAKTVNDTGVECPRHGARFDLFTGRVLALPAVRPVTAYETVVDGDEVRVRLS